MDIDLQADLVYLAECSHAAYMGRIPSRLPFQNHMYLHDGQAGVHRGFVGQGEGFIVVAIKGTKSLLDFVVDARFRKVPFLGRPELMVHEGFNDEFTAIWPMVQKAVLAGRGNVLITGHSLGAAIASLIAFALKEVHGISAHRTVLLGCPRVGNYAFSKAYNKHVPLTWRIVDDMDLVPRIPKWFFWHFRHLLHLRENGSEVHPTHSFFKNLWNTLKVLLSDIDGESIGDHDSAKYVKVVQSIGWGRRVSNSDTPKP